MIHYASNVLIPCDGQLKGDRGPAAGVAQDMGVATDMAGCVWNLGRFSCKWSETIGTFHDVFQKLYALVNFAVSKIDWKQMMEMLM